MPFRWGVRDALAFGNADEIVGLIREKRSKKIVAKRGEVPADVVKITTTPTPTYTLACGDQRRRLLLPFPRDELEGDELDRLVREAVSFEFEIGPRIQFPRASFSLGWSGNDATSDTRRWIGDGDGDDLTFDGDYLL